MIKRITSFFSMLLLFAVGANAQVLPELQQKTVIFGGAVAEFELNKWYLIGSTSDGSSPYGSYSPWDHPEIGETPQHGGFFYDSGVGENVNKIKVADIEDGASTVVAAKYIVRILESANQDGAYILQFGTGNYIAPIAGVSDGSAALKSATSLYDAQDFYIYTVNYVRESDANNDENLRCPDESVEDGPLPGRFGFCTFDTDKRQLNQNGVDKHFCWWLKGETTYWLSNSHMAIYEVSFGEASEYDAAMQELQAVIDTYDQYKDLYEAGTQPGQFDADALEAFLEALDNAYDVAENDDPENPVTADQLKELAQAIVDAYNALMETQVKFTLAPGYYFIESARDWVNTITIPAEDEDGEETTETTYPTKAIYANGDNISWKTLVEDDCTFLWKITPEEDTENYVVQSMANDKYWGVINQSTAVKFVEEESSLKIIPNMNFTNEEGYIVVNLQHSTQTGDYQYAHCESHNGGQGVKGNIVGWAANDAPSTWIVVPVDEETAQQMMADYEIIKNHDALVADWQEMRSNATKAIEIAHDVNVVLNEDMPLITDAEQLSSPHSDSAEGQHLEYLIDGNTSTFWHTDYHGSAPEGLHYLCVEMPDADIENAAFTFTRRNTSNDHITGWKVCGTNDFEAETDDCEVLAEFETPFSSTTETLTSGIFPTKGYAYIRFCITNSTTNRTPVRFGHMTEFQLYPAEVVAYDPCQYDLLGDLVTNLEKVMEEQAEIDPAELTVDEYNAMKSVYDAFAAKYVDPTPLRDKMKDVKSLLDWKQIGNNPGEWKDDSSFAALEKSINTANAYDLTSNYTPEKSDELIAAIDAAAENIVASANKIQTNKWYRIQLGTEEVYDEHPSWDKGNLTESATDLELFGKYLTIAKQIAPGDGTYTLESPAPADLYLGTMLYFQAENDLSTPDLALWRFIAVGDTAYVLQNKATGMFLHKNKKYVPYVDAQPTLYTTTPVGYGFNIIVPETFAGEKFSPLHAAKAYNRLTTWNATTAGTNSAMYIKEAEDIAADYDGSVVQTRMRPGAVTAMCYAVEMASATESAKLYYAHLNGTELSLCAMPDNKAKAGVPFIVINGDPAAYNTEDEADVIKFVHGYDIATEPGQIGDLIGTYEEKEIGAGKVVTTANGFEVTKKTASVAGVNEAYIAGESDIENLEAEITFVISDVEDSIENVLTNVAKNGVIYTLDGRVAGQGNLNSVKNLGRGIYILNGVKIAVK